MADLDNHVTSVIQTQQQRLNSKSYVPATKFRGSTLGAEGVANKLFIAFLFSDPDEDGVQFLKDVGLIPSKSGSQMSWCVDTSVKVGYRWQCLRAISASACGASILIMHGTWFQQSNLKFMVVLLLTYDIDRRVPAHAVQQECQFGSAIITEGTKLCREHRLSKRGHVGLCALAALRKSAVPTRPSKSMRTSSVGA